MPPIELKINHIDRGRTGFHASDYGKLGYDLFCDFTGVERTNPARWYETLKWGAGKGVELQMLTVLKDSGYVPQEYDQLEEVPTVVFEREGVKVTCHVDAINIHGEPVEIKSINNKNAIDINKYKDNKPRENYVGQLAIYMDALGKEKGHLFVAAVDGLSYFWFVCEHLGDRIYKCGETTVDLNKEYKRWATLKSDFIDAGKEPDVFEAGRYKIPVNEIDWTKYSVSTISAVRTGRKVLGDEDAWKILYSPWKDLIVHKQGSEVGYTIEELQEILLKTKGFSSKKNGQTMVGEGVGTEQSS